MRMLAVPVLLAAGILGFAPAASAAVTSITGSDLSGANEVPPSDASLEGTAAVSLDAETGDVCYEVEANFATATGMHIHRGEVGVNGPIVVPLDPTRLNATTETCTVAAAELVAEIKAKPAAFYVNVHTETYPGGAIRGQLTTGILLVELSPAQEVPPTTSTQSGQVRIFMADPTQICVEPELTITTATGMHIHRGEIGTNGPVVVPFDHTQLTALQCVSVAAELGAEIAGNPSAFYFNVHTAAFPGGEIRGQLAIAPAVAPAPTPPPAPVPTVPVVLPVGVNAGSGGQATETPVSSSPLVALAALAGGSALIAVRVAGRRRAGGPSES
ncbi:MAG: hypothetical protein AVDCRST_MAG50-1958 [uncultured Acidimicrobiales bacterium]|uniref:CHRD domain-containing protein n=1 Tax=uncultured Acidimicrobiales bacterium TaxID=310071 RepID=A0A6J4IBX5_9ACTN|nr:MAG: hypothetical protein AVDCRST_MAG50-1958 [uncultured Acidimicrobiales bacterium]